MCRSCERWNLSPIEERWEALEECERAFDKTRLRVSTEEIGLARIAEGLELVRIGKPKRPEFAAWRYGDQFGRRRRKHMMVVGGVAVATIGIAVGQVAFGFALGGVTAFQIFQGARALVMGRTSAATVHANGERLRLTPKDIGTTNLIWSSSAKDWSLLIPWRNSWGLLTGSQIIETQEAYDFLAKSGREGEGVMELQGYQARRGLGKIMAAVNASGGDTKTIQAAVDEIERTPDTEAFLQRTGQMFAGNRRLLGMSLATEGGSLRAIRPELRLAMEMAANEENERKALLGELELLKDEWRAAEEIAAISDKLFVSRDVQKNLQDLKNKNLKT